MRFALALMLACASAGCLRATQFTCDVDGDCGAGRCEPTGFCSFEDASCSGGRRYGELSGSLAGACLTSSTDPDAAPSRCPDTYAPINGSPHVYRLRMTIDDWGDHRDVCANEGGFLAIPDDQAELDLIAGLSPGNDIWIGVRETSTEGTYETSLGAPATFLPWDPGEPDDAGSGDCARIFGPTRGFRDERCLTIHRGVCECVP
jgi:hypothetical protein